MSHESLSVVLFLMMGIVTSVAMLSEWDLFWEWVLVETMIFLVIPLLLVKGSSRGSATFWSPGVVAYFSAQCAGAVLILFGLFVHSTMSAELTGSCLACAGYALKLGLFPFNFWVKLSFKEFHYMGVFISGFAQKLYIVPMVPLFYDEAICANAMYCMSLLSVLCGPILMFNASEVKVVLSHLSLSFTGTLMLCSYCGLHVTYVYGAIYCLSVFFMAAILLNSNCKDVKDLGSKVPLHYKIGFLCLMISMSGHPLSVDFVMKEKMLELLGWEAGATVSIAIVVVGSLINLLSWVRLMVFATKGVEKALAFSGSPIQNLFNIICVILSLFSGFAFGIITT
uniref:NADH-ubiquinone oxidoreductase chain 2 n=1 Tax=Crassostrea sp. DB1 TaxID=545777 RepID=J9PSZ5_9BIVA|nr:hypothetical protein D230_mgp10 [Crassostrea sp. DB1]AEX37756.1 hypothetical protein [Crassostrea sp. DB1]